MSGQRIVNALSFDIEDWFHLVDIDAVADPAVWPTLPSLVERYTDYILQQLADARVRATFFTLGWVARRHPRLVRTIAAAGHEVALHSYWHRRCDRLTRDELYTDLAENKDIVEQQSSQRVLGFRAPSFSIRPGCEWVFGVLDELGLRYDSSLFPAPRGAGGYACEPQPHRLPPTSSGRQLWELPISVWRLGPLKLPFSGGGYLRLLPKWAIRRGFAAFHQSGLPVVVYLHPRDFAADCPRVPMPPHRRFKSYVGLASTAGKFAMLLREYRFDCCAAVLGLDALLASAPVTQRKVA